MKNNINEALKAFETIGVGDVMIIPSLGFAQDGVPLILMSVEQHTAFTKALKKAKPKRGKK